MIDYSKYVTTRRLFKAIILFLFFTGCILLYRMIETEQLPDITSIVMAAIGGTSLTGLLAAMLFFNPSRNLIKKSTRNIVIAINVTILQFSLAYIILYFFAADKMDWPAILRSSISTGVVCGIVIFYIFRSKEERKSTQHVKTDTQAL